MLCTCTPIFLFVTIFVLWGWNFLRHQSVRDRTAQAGTPILKFTNIYMNKVYEHEVLQSGNVA